MGETMSVCILYTSVGESFHFIVVVSVVVVSAYVQMAVQLINFKVVEVFYKFGKIVVIFNEVAAFRGAVPSAASACYKVVVFA